MSDGSVSSQSNRPPLARHSSTSSHVSQSPADTHPPSTAHRSGHHKSGRHVVGQGRMGPRNPSLGRNLSKLTISTAAANAKQEEGPVSARLESSGTPLMSPRHKNTMKRTQTSLALPRTASHTALKKNHSSGQLTRLSTSKNHSKHARPEIHRSHTGPAKAKQKSPPPPDPNQPTVHFDVGDEEDGDGEGMEGVDDGWTEDSASQSPTTTRENTRSNTRENSVVLDPDRNPYAQHKEKPPDIQEDSPETAQSTAHQDFAPSKTPPAPSSYHEAQQSRTLDADAIARRLLQRSQQANPPPRVSDVSALADAGLGDSKSITSYENGQLSSTANGSAPLVSRFIGESSAPGSKDGTPQEQSTLLNRRQRAEASLQSRDGEQDKSDMKRNQSLPNFGMPYSPSLHESGITTPGGAFRPSRTQQKLWLQRGLSNIEANSQSHLPTILSSGRLHRGGSAMRQFEKVEKELAVVRRFRSPVADSVERLKKLNGGSPKQADGANGDKSPQKKHQSGTRTPGAQTPKSDRPNPIKQRVSFALSTPDDEDEHRENWHHMTLEELEDATLDMRRQMWELVSAGEE